MIKENTHTTCVLVMSCDRYYDLWDPFFHFFEKYWPDCPFPVYLATNTKNYARKNVTVLQSQLHSTWSAESAAILQQLPYEHIIYLQDDYFLLKPVVNATINRLLDKMALYGADHVRLFPSPGPDAVYKQDDELGLITAHAPYRTSLQCAAWKKNTFLQLLDAGENQWQFEVNGSKRSAPYLFLSVKRLPGKIQQHAYPVTYYYLTAVLRGQWRREAYQLCRQEGLQPDTQYRPVETYSAMLYQMIYQASPLFFQKVADYFSGKLLKKK